MNLNSLTNKINLVNKLLINHNISLAGICETWLTKKVISSVVNIDGYDFIRNDSPNDTSKHGVGIYIYSRIKLGRTFKCHPNTVGLHLADLNLYVLLVYRPPSNSLIENALLLSFLYSFCKDKNIILFGDFNLANINWLSNTTPVENSFIDEQFLDLFLSLDLKQWVLFPTFFSSGNVLDLVLTSEDDSISFIEDLPPLPGCGHCGVTFGCSF